MDSNILIVGMADLKIGKNLTQLKTIGLGSCVGVTLYDKSTKIGGLAHIMLPHIEEHKGADGNPAKYADSAIELLITRLVRAGASSSRLEAKIAGGAQMFKRTGMDTFRIGPRNVETCKAVLALAKIPLLAEDVGADYGRTILLDCSTGLLNISSISHGKKDV